MQISFTPQRRDDALELYREGDRLTINGAVFDFTPLQEGDVLPCAAVASAWLAADVTRSDGQIRLKLFLPHGPDAPEALRFPQPLILMEDGPVALPGQTEEVAA